MRHSTKRISHRAFHGGREVTMSRAGHFRQFEKAARVDSLKRTRRKGATAEAPELEEAGASRMTLDNHGCAIKGDWQ
jgi:hypothetical protein